GWRLLTGGGGDLAHSRRAGHRDPLGPVPRDAHRGRRGRAHRGTTHRARRRRRSPMTDRGAPRSASTLTSEERRRLEARLLAGAPAARTTLPRRDPGAPVPLSPPQQRLWFLHQLVPDSAVYHIPIVAGLRGRAARRIGPSPRGPPRPHRRRGR